MAGSSTASPTSRLGVAMYRLILCNCRKGGIAKTAFYVRNFALLTFVIVTLWIFPTMLWRVRPGKEVVETRQISKYQHQSTTLPSALQAKSTVLPTTINSSEPRGYLSQRPPMAGTGLGNIMFMYASLLGIAAKKDMIPVYPSDGPLRNNFNISTVSLNPLNSISIQERKASAFNSHLTTKPDRKRNETVVGYLQSWKYFGEISELVRREFTFMDIMRTHSEEFLSNASQNFGTSHTATVFVGVHIRRGDMLFNYNIQRGYTVATKEYLANAVSYFLTQFPSTNIVFVVCSDDLKWSRENFPHLNSTSSFVTFSEGRPASWDMALLAACNHSIITVGTFSWWSAYLAGGRTVYYKDFPKPSTFIAGLLVKEDFFPSNWIAM